MADLPFTNDLPYCAWAALRLLREREQGYSRRVAAGQMAKVEASHRIAIASALVAQWRWAIDPQVPPFPAATSSVRPFGALQAELLHQLRATVAWEQRRAAAAPADADHRERKLLAEALLWHQEAPDACWPPIIHYGLIARRAPSQRYVPAPEDEPFYHALGLSLPPLKRAA